MKCLLALPGGLASDGHGHFIPVLASLTEQIAQVHDLTVFVLAQDEIPREYEFSGARVVSLGAPLDLSSNRWPLLEKARQFRRALRRHGPFDLVHAFWANTCGFLAAVAVPRRVPIVVSLAGGEFACLPGIGYGQQTSAAGRMRVRFALSRARTVTAASGFIETQAKEHGFVVCRVPLGVGPGSFLPVAAVRDHPPFSILSIASLNRVKGPFVLLEAFRSVLDSGIEASLTLIGEDSLGGSVEQRAFAMGLSGHTVFRGHLPPADVRAALRTADLLAISSFHEAGPVSALEAAAAGVPIAGTAVGHLADWGPDLCATVPAGDARGLGQVMAGLLTTPSRREALRRRAGEWVRVHDAAHTASEFLKIYESLGGT